MGPFALGDGAFDGNVIDLSVIVSLLPLVIKVGVGASGNCENCAMGGKLLVCCGGSWICSGCDGGGLVFGLFCWLALFGIG
jgi:hypothetical protein